MTKKLRMVASATLLTLTIVAVTEVRSDETAGLVEQGEAELQRGDVDAAIASFSQAVEVDPQSSLAHTRLGGALLIKQDHQAAIAQFQEAISADTNNAPAFIGLGVSYLHLKQPGPAKAALAEAKRLDPERGAEIDALLKRIEQTASAPH